MRKNKWCLLCDTKKQSSFVVILSYKDIFIYVKKINLIPLESLHM